MESSRGLLCGAGRPDGDLMGDDWEPGLLVEAFIIGFAVMCFVGSWLVS